MTSNLDISPGEALVTWWTLVVGPCAGAVPVGRLPCLSVHGNDQEWDESQCHGNKDESLNQ